jgi:hypothetical protein
MKDYRSVGIKAASLYASYEFYFGKRKSMPLPTPFRSFHNALRILRALDFHEVDFLKDAEWFAFRDNPYDFFMTTSDSNASLIWQAVQRRQPQELKQ